MASSDHSDSSTPSSDSSALAGIQTQLSPSTEAPSIPLKPLPRRPAMTVERFTSLRNWFDGMLVALVLIFAFLVASFPVGNPDFFRQAATGRLLAQGGYRFGVDPFTFSGDSVYWVNHSWLFALLMYGLYQIPAIGGTAVVVFKALLIAALAELLLRTSRRVGQSLWIPSACTALAILALSPRLYLQPVCLSFLFLGLTLWLLVTSRTHSSRRLWWLPPLFALWANCDAWFLLGPLAVVLSLGGELIEWFFPTPQAGRDDSRGRQLKTLALVLVVGLAACLLNPHHVRVFALPVELGLSPGNEVIERDPQFRPFSLSPLQSLYLEPKYGSSVAGWSYPPLLLLGMVSFVFVFGRASWWHLLVWLGFAALSLYNVRCVPFFAIVAGPITALNWLDLAARLKKVSGTDSEEKTVPDTFFALSWSLGGRVLSILMLLVLLMATVPGWLQMRPYDYRRVGWRVVPDPSLQQAAEQINTWRRNQLLPAEPHWFNTRYEVASYLAWFAPGERAFLDLNLPYFPDAADDYLKLRDALKSQAPREDNASDEELLLHPPPSKGKWKKVLRDRHVRYWIFDNLNLQEADREAKRVLFSNPQEWDLCSIHGRIAIFRWREAESKDERAPPKMDLKHLAFGPKAEQAPSQGPEVVASPRGFWDRWLYPDPAPPVDRQAALLYDYRFQTAGKRQRLLELHEDSRAWQAAVTVGAIGAALPHGPMPSSLLEFGWSCTYHDLFPPENLQAVRSPQPNERGAMTAWTLYVNSQLIEPPSSLFLAVRAARRALLENPQDPQTYQLLGEEYARLDSQVYERALKTSAPLAEEIRRTQLVAAYLNCLRFLHFQPSPAAAAEAHAVLYDIFNQLHYLDAATHHLSEWLKALREMKPEDSKMSATQRARALDEMGRELKRREDEVKRAQEFYEVNAANKPRLEKVGIALEKGLVETAMTTLLQATTEEATGQKERTIVRRSMTVLLNLGRLDEARDLLIPDAEEAEGKPVAPDYLPLHLRLATARGDYERADRLLADALNYAWQDPRGIPMHFAERRDTAAAVGRVLLGTAQRSGGAPRLPSPQGEFPSDYWVRRWCLDALESGMRVSQERTQWLLLRGWLAAESGRSDQARTSFREVLDTVVLPARWMPAANKLEVLSPRINQDLMEIQLLQQLGARQGGAQHVSRQYLNWLEETQR